MNRDFRDLLAAFAAHEVRFLVVGGYAVTFHSHPRSRPHFEFGRGLQAGVTAMRRSAPGYWPCQEKNGSAIGASFSWKQNSSCGPCSSNHARLSSVTR